MTEDTVIPPLWPQWCEEHLDLRSYLTDVEEEARARGHHSVNHAHMTLAFTNRKPSMDSLMKRFGLDPIQLRDRIIYIEGVNDGIRSHMTKTQISGNKPANELRFEGNLAVDARVVDALEEARRVARSVDAGVKLEHVVVGLQSTPLTAFHGITLAKAKSLAGVPHERRVVAPGADRTKTLRPPSISPMILCGGGEPDESHIRALDVVAEHRGIPRSELDVALIFAAIPELTDAQRDQYYLNGFSEGGAKVADIGLNRRSDSASPAVLEAIGSADLVYFSGGRPEWIMDTLLGTPALEALSKAAHRGAVMMGSSAGCLMWGVGAMSDWESGDEPEPFPLLNWLDGVVLVPHTMGLESAELVRDWMIKLDAPIGLGVAHMGAIVAEPGWRTFRQLEEGFGSSFVLASADAEPQLIKP